MHALTLNFLVVHVAVCLALKSLHKLARHAFHKLMDWLSRKMFALFIAPLIDEIGRELKSLAANCAFAIRC